VETVVFDPWSSRFCVCVCAALLSSVDFFRALLSAFLYSSLLPFHFLVLPHSLFVPSLSLSFLCAQVILCSFGAIANFVWMNNNALSNWYLPFALAGDKISISSTAGLSWFTYLVLLDILGARFCKVHFQQKPGFSTVSFLFCHYFSFAICYVLFKIIN
jgi:hypothetical protein